MMPVAKQLKLKGHAMGSSVKRRAFLLRGGGLAAAAALGIGESTRATGAEPPIRRARKLRDGQGDSAAATGGRPAKHAIPGSPSPAYSRAVEFNRLVFVAGCVGTDRRGGESVMPPDFERQAMNTLNNLKASVEAAGSSMASVLKCTCFLKKYEHFKQFNDIYMKFFPEPRPARSTVVVADFVVPGALLEVDCVCCLD